MPLLSMGTSIYVSQCPELEVLQLAALEEVLYNLQVYSCGSLEILTLPLLKSVGANLEIGQNTVLNQFDLVGLEHVETKLWVEKNPALPQCLVDELVAQLDVLPSDGAISSGNDGVATCD